MINSLQETGLLLPNINSTIQVNAVAIDSSSVMSRREVPNLDRVVVTLVCGSSLGPCVG